MYLFFNKIKGVCILTASFSTTKSEKSNVLGQVRLNDVIEFR